MRAEIGKKAPNLDVSEWVQGEPSNLDREAGNIVLVEVFQVNCPGCFAHALPEAIELHSKYAGEGVRVWGVATAFEDFDKNTPENLRMLLKTGRVVGDTLESLGGQGLLDGDRLGYSIPFPVAADTLRRRDPDSVSDSDVEALIRSQLPGFDSEPEERRSAVFEQVRAHLRSREYTASVFDTYMLRGTPSTILVDRSGVLRDVSFGQAGTGMVEAQLRRLIRE